MKPHRRDKIDLRIERALKAGLLSERPPAGSRFQVLRSAASSVMAPARVVGWVARPDWTTPSTDRRLQRDRLALEGRKYGYIVVTASFRLAW